MSISRTPRMSVIIDGQEILGALSARASFGLDQEMATADVTFETGRLYTANIRKFSRIILMGGGSNFIERFTGYVLDFDAALWPGRETIKCGDTMALLAAFYPLADVDLSGLTDTQAINAVLDEVGIPAQLRNISGTGKIIAPVATVSTTWPAFQSALEAVKEIDSISLGYRTIADPTGMIHRVLINTTPGVSAALSFVEGVDILPGSANFSSIDPKNEITAIGDGVQFTASNPETFNWRNNPWWQRYAMLQQQATSGGQLSVQEVAEWVLGELNRYLIKVSFATARDDYISLPMTIACDSPRMRVDQNFWLQSLTVEMSNAKFRQNIGLVSELSEDSTLAPGIQTPFESGSLPPGAKINPLAPRTPIAISNNDVRPAFTVTAIDKQIVLIGGVETPLYVVCCVDNSTSFQGTITTRSWVASGGGAAITSGSLKTFTTAFTDLSAASITLTVTDSNGRSKAITKTPLDNIGVPIRVRKIYAITDAVFEAFDGTNWRSYIPSAGSPTALANGPEAGAGPINITTVDDLATTPTETTPLPGVDITSIWAELDASVAKRVVGFADGRVGISTDSGATITIVTQPPGTEVRRVILSRFVSGQIHVITDTGYYVSDNNGSGWRVIVEGDFTDLILAPGRNVLVSSAGTLLLAAPALTPFVPALSASIVCATSHIREDKFYALDTLGRTWHQASEASGSYALVQGQSLPSGSPQVRGMYRHGTIIDKVYFAAGSGGLWETIDGFRSAGGYFQLRV